MAERGGNIVELRSAFKRFSTDDVILQGLNMTVEQGTIYALLGPSGCGKTTLLRCVTGNLRLDSGSVTVALESKKQLGYMPQEIALMERLTVSEMLRYFGKVNGLSSSEVESRGEEILQLLDLPPDAYLSRTIQSLSGGQQRRASLAVALLHNPVLLILDEPTVGLDPLINERIWQFFITVTEERRKTIIITTHYIEEARNAHKVGLMRDGVLLAEKTPLQLLSENNCEALEDVFLMLSHKQQNSKKIEDYPKKTFVPEPIKEDSWWDNKRAEAEIFKNFCWVTRNIPILLLITAIPAVLMFLFNEVYSNTMRGVNIAAVSGEAHQLDSCLHVDIFNASSLLCSPQSRLNCLFLHMLQEKSYTVVEYEDVDSARAAVTHGQAHAVLHFSNTFSWSLINLLSESLDTQEVYINNSMVDTYVDMSDFIISNLIKKDLRDSFFELTEHVFAECGFNLRAAHNLIKFEKPVYGQSTPTFVETAVGGFVIPFSFYMTSLFSSISLNSEKVSGFLERSFTSGVCHTEIMFAHVVVQTLVIICQKIMLLTVAYGVYSLPLKGSFSLLVFFILLADIQGMFYGFFLGTLFNGERGISYSAVGTMMCMFLSCGFAWPLEGGHWAMYKVMSQFPIAMAVQSYRSITLRGWGLSHPYIIKTAVANIIFAFIFLAMYITLCKLKK